MQQVKQDKRETYIYTQSKPLTPPVNNYSKVKPYELVRPYLFGYVWVWIYWIYWIRGLLICCPKQTNPKI